MSGTVVGITLRTVNASLSNHSSAQEFNGIPMSYLRVLSQAGFSVRLLPQLFTLSELQQNFQDVDAILVPGGEDIHPQNYGEAPSGCAFPVDEHRDENELWLARASIGENKPFLGICRGAQVLNVAAGGSLLQHIEGHRGDRSMTYHHSVELDPKSRLARITGVERFEVNSLHHQAASRVGDGLTAIAHATDGTIEAVEHREVNFCFGLQWHPEILCDEISTRIFMAFLHAAKS